MKLFNRILGWQGLDGCEQTLPPLEFYERSPSSSPGILPYPLDQLLESQQDILIRIRQAVPYGDDYDRYYLPLVRRYAAYVHLLPASQNHHHREVGGLLRHGLEVAEGSLTQFNQIRVEANKHTVKILSLGCFFAGLHHDLPKVFSDMEIYDSDQGLIFRPFESSLMDWLEKNKVNNYQVKYRPGRHRKHDNYSVVTLACLLPEAIRSYLCSAGNEVSSEIFMGIHAFPENIISKCVFEADQKSVKKYMKSAPTLAGSTIGACKAPHEYLTLAINRLFSGGVWQVNEAGGPAKLVDGHLYLVWPRAAKEMVSLLVADYISAIPRDPEEIAQILLDWGLIDEGEFGSPYWFIELEGGSSLKTVRLVGLSRWLCNIQRPISVDKSLEEKEQQVVVAKPVAEFQSTEIDSVVQHFLQTLKSPNPPFPVQAVDQYLYTCKTDAEKWFGKKGVSRSQMLRFVRGGQLGLVKIKTRNGEEKMIGPPS